MSNSQSNRPRRSFATGSTPSDGRQQNADILKYDGEDVPVLIRLPDLSPQAQLRQPGPQAPSRPASTRVTKEATAKKEKPADSVEATTSTDHASPRLAPTLKPTDVPTQTTSAETVTPQPIATEPKLSVAAEPKSALPATPEPNTDGAAADQTKVDQQPATTVAAGKSATPTTGDPIAETPANNTSTPSNEQGSPRNRRRKRDGRDLERKTERVDQAGEQSSRQGARRRPGTGPTATRQDQHILAFDKSRILIGAGLVVVAGLTFFALSGGSEDPEEPADTWAGGTTGAVVQTAEPAVEPEVDLWPAPQQPQAAEDESALPAHQAVGRADEGVAPTTQAPAWPVAPRQQTVDSLDPNSLPTADYSNNAPLITAPANGQNYVDSNHAAPVNNGSTTGWPEDSPAATQPTSTTLPVSSWPDAAMTPANHVPSGAPHGYYQSQAAGYTTSPPPTDGHGDAPAIRTGRLETSGPTSGSTLNATANPGSQLNGTIEIPRPRANNEYNGSNVY